MKYLSVCSGIEAATVAWHPLGWSPVAFAEIEKFPSAVLAHHYPHVPNLGDMTKFKDWPDATPDVLVGGTPCQSFSVAGLRKGMADPRGNLALTYLAIADRYRPEWLLWENVPGVLSSSDGRDFGAFLGGLAELGYGFAYRVLDAQYVRVDGFGRAVAQRRRRVFVVGNSRDWRRAAAVLFERESLSWNSPPRRETGERVAPTISARPTGGGGLGTDFDLDGGLIQDIARTVTTDEHQRQDWETCTIFAVAPVASTLPAGGNLTGGDRQPGTSAETAGTMLVAHALRGEGFDASEDGTGRGTPLVPVPAIASDCKASGQSGFGVGEIASTLRSMGHADSHQNGGGHQAVAFSITPSNSNEDYNAREAAKSQALTRSGNRPSARGGDLIAQTWAVRRLTPTECERLQGFPDGYTNVPWRGKDRSPDGPRYKALGNSMAVNAMRWIGRRIQMVSDLNQLAQAAE